MKPDEFVLEQNYPNPFNPSTNFGFRIPPGRDGSSNLGLVTLKVYDVLGNEVATVVNQVLLRANTIFHFPPPIFHYPVEYISILCPPRAEPEAIHQPKN